MLTNSRATVVLGVLLAVGGLAALDAMQIQKGDDHQHHGAVTPPSTSVTQVIALPPAVGDLTLVDSSGRTIALNEALAADGPVLVNFIFTTCTTICPVMSAGFAQLDRRFQAGQQRVRLVSISIDPDADTPSRLRGYASRLGASQDWWFLTGEPAEVEAAQRAFGAYYGGKENHRAATFIRRAPAAPWERMDGLPTGAALLSATTAARK